jgi:hypothetical protein
MSAHITMQMHAQNYLGERRRLGFGMRTLDYSINSFARYVDALRRRHDHGCSKQSSNTKQKGLRTYLISFAW